MGLDNATLRWHEEHKMEGESVYHKHYVKQAIS